MADDKIKTDKPVADDVAVVDEPKSEPQADEPVADVSASTTSDVSQPAGDVLQSTGTDQHGRQLFSVTCASCGKPAQVPFKPSGNRPVYCRDCYMQQRRGSGGMNRGPGR